VKVIIAKVKHANDTLASLHSEPALAVAPQLKRRAFGLIRRNETFAAWGLDV
jgi:hypothetical protein